MCQEMGAPARKQEPAVDVTCTIANGKWALVYKKLYAHLQLLGIYRRIAQFVHSDIMFSDVIKMYIW